MWWLRLHLNEYHVNRVIFIAFHVDIWCARYGYSWVNEFHQGNMMYMKAVGSYRHGRVDMARKSRIGAIFNLICIRFLWWIVANVLLFPLRSVKSTLVKRALYRRCRSRTTLAGDALDFGIRVSPKRIGIAVVVCKKHKGAEDSRYWRTRNCRREDRRKRSLLNST